MTNFPSVRPFFVLAPMDDVTDTVFRQVIASIGAPDLFFTEFVNVDGLQSPGREKLLFKLRKSAKETPIIAQIWGKNPDNFYKTAVDLVQMGYDGIDLNFGCASVAGNGSCIGMIHNRELVGEIIRATKRGAGSLPVSVKTRLGLGEIDFSWHQFLLSQTLNMLTIHGRTAKQKSNAPVNWEAIKTIRKMRDQLCPSTLFVGNGDILDRQSGEVLAKRYGLDGLMIARGVFQDPYVFSKDIKWSDIGKQQRIDLYKKHIKLFAKTWTKGERQVHTLNKFCKVYINGFDDAKELREQLMAASTTDQLLKILN